MDATPLVERRLSDRADSREYKRIRGSFFAVICRGSSTFARTLIQGEARENESMKQLTMWACNELALAVVLGLAIGCAGLSADTEVSRTEVELGSTSQALSHDRDLEDPDGVSAEAEPASEYTLFEADPVRPVAVLEKSELVAVTNTCLLYTSPSPRD